MQQSEEHLEARRQEKMVQEKKFEKLISDLENNEQNNETRIQNSMQDRDALLNMDQDNSIDSLPVELESSIQ